MRKGVVCRAESEPETFPAPQSPVTLLQCIAKGPRMDWLVEKATELGALRIVPVVSGRTVCRFRPGEIIDRWQRIADSAIEQCDGVWRTEIMPVATFAGMLDALARCPVKMAAALTPDAVPIAEFLRESAAGETAVCIGPEGDFSPEEYDSLRAAGAKMAGLGTRVLRVETAAVYALSAISAFRV